MFNNNATTTSGFISGEIKLAIAMRLLAGGDSYNLAVAFDARADHCTRIVYNVLLN